MSRLTREQQDEIAAAQGEDEVFTRMERDLQLRVNLEVFHLKTLKVGCPVTYRQMDAILFAIGYMEAKK